MRFYQVAFQALYERINPCESRPRRRKQDVENQNETLDIMFCDLSRQNNFDKKLKELHSAEEILVLDNHSTFSSQYFAMVCNRYHSLPRGPTPTLFSVEVSCLTTCLLKIRVQQQEECYINLTLLQNTFSNIFF